MALTRAVRYVREIEDNDLLSLAEAIHLLRKEWEDEIEAGDVMIEIAITARETEE